MSFFPSEKLGLEFTIHNSPRWSIGGGMINIDKSGANREAGRTYNKRRLKRIMIRNVSTEIRIEGDHRFIKS
jgi:hypothetical protein